MLGQLVVAVKAEAGKNLGSDGSPPPFSPLVVLSFLPCGKASPRRHPFFSFFQYNNQLPSGGVEVMGR